MFELIPAYHGLAAINGSMQMLPPGGLHDHALDAELPLQLAASEAEVRHLVDAMKKARGASASLKNHVMAATHYGSTAQSKPSNQDFAASAIFRAPNGGMIAVAAVADGVSSKTLWPHRASRLAVLGSFLAVHAALRDGWFDADKALEETTSLLREAIVERVQKSYRADQEKLRQENAVPAHYTPTFYSQVEGQDRRWYQTTLLLALASANGMFAMWIGDGEIVLVRDRYGSTERKVLLPPSDTHLTNAITLETPSRAMTICHIRREPSWQRATLILASDGWSSTWSRTGKTLDEWENLGASAIGSSIAHRVALGGESLEEDNLSFARLRACYPASP